MAKKSKIARLPSETIEELDLIKNQFSIESTGDALKEMAKQSKKGRLKKIKFEFDPIKW